MDSDEIFSAVFLHESKPSPAIVHIERGGRLGTLMITGTSRTLELELTDADLELGQPSDNPSQLAALFDLIEDKLQADGYTRSGARGDSNWRALLGLTPPPPLVATGASYAAVF
ncbi:MAG: hypothetical protein A2580_18100 [Hydrogenophilales bacterium RIFOXYD1_FULL_62_11]|nr:MAG: hypothetical protein A2580_18100 [Hydrogenophilales bacterium RIFOXYD1_FULL_62_11]